METTSQMKALDERFFMPAFSREIAIVKGEGSKVWDGAGKEYIDCLGGYGMMDHGWGHPEIVAAVRDQLSYRTPMPSQELIDPLKGVSGNQPTRTYPWYINVCRQRIRASGQEVSAFSPTGISRFGVPSKFAELIVK